MALVHGQWKGSSVRKRTPLDPAQAAVEREAAKIREQMEPIKDTPIFQELVDDLIYLERKTGEAVKFAGIIGNRYGVEGGMVLAYAFHKARSVRLTKP
jgi:hypothetical protein